MRSKNSRIVILYVEDDLSTLETLSKLLQSRLPNSEVLTAQNGEEGFEMFAQYRPEVVISDIQMPKVNGLEMIRRIREIDTEVAVILLSALNDTEHFAQAIDLGIAQFISKPIVLGRLLETVKRFVEKAYAMRELKEQSNLLSQYKKAVDTSNIVSKTDAKGIITFVNEQFCAISGYTEDELVGQPHNIIRHLDMPREAFRELWETVQSKKVWQGIVKNRTKNGGFYYVKSTVIPILDSSENIIEYIGIRNDITEIEMIREKLRDDLQITASNLEEAHQLSREYENAIDESNILSRTDLDGVIKYANDSFCKVCGYSKGELMGKKHSLIRHPDMPDAVHKELWSTIKSGKIWKGTLKNVKKDGTTYWVDSVILPIHNNAGKTVEYMAISHDISDIISLHQELEDTQREVIYRMGEIGECRSKEAGHHVKRVAEYSKLLALKAGIPEADAQLLANASPMHDIGKVGIPDAVLLKPAKLDETEWEIMKSHSQIGHSILKGSERPLLKTAAIVAHQHHERIDGKGYPLGLKGDEIHIYARITAIADVFDALGSERVYKNAWKIDDILELFKKERGLGFDERLVDLFLENIDEFLLIRDKYLDL